MEDITGSDFNHPKRICKDFEMRSFGEYDDLRLKIGTLLLADVFENFNKICLDIYQLNLAKFLSATGLAWKTPLKKTKVKLVLLAYIYMLLMVEKGIRGRNNKNIWKTMMKIKNCNILDFGMQLICTVRQWCKNCL